MKSAVFYLPFDTQSYQMVREFKDKDLFLSWFKFHISEESFKSRDDLSTKVKALIKEEEVQEYKTEELKTKKRLYQKCVRMMDDSTILHEYVVKLIVEGNLPTINKVFIKTFIDI